MGIFHYLRTMPLTVVPLIKESPQLVGSLLGRVLILW